MTVASLKPHRFSSLGAAEAAAGTLRARELVFHDLPAGQRRVSLRLVDETADYGTPIFEEYVRRTAVEGGQYLVPVAVAGTRPRGSVVIGEYLQTVLIPVVPLRYLYRLPGDVSVSYGERSDREFETAPLRPGRIYIFLHGYLWREFEVVNEEGVLREVNLTLYQGADERPATVRADNRILLPYRDATDRDVEDALQICYSEVPWSWAYICRMGGMSPEDPRYIAALHDGTCDRDFSGIAPDPDLRKRRMQSLQMRRYWLDTTAECHRVWEGHLAPIETLADQTSLPYRSLHRESQVAALALYDPLAIARDLARAYQTAWAGMELLMKLVQGEAGEGMAPDASATAGERRRQAEFLHEMRQQQAAFRCALTLQQRFCEDAAPKVDAQANEETKLAQRESQDAWKKFRLNLDWGKIATVLRADERRQQRELIARTKRELVSFIENQPALTDVVEDYFCLEPGRLHLAVELMATLLARLAHNPSKLDAWLERKPIDQLAELRADPGVHLGLRLLGVHSFQAPHPWAAWLWPKPVGDDPEDLLAYEVTPVAPGLPDFDPNKWMLVLKTGKQVGALFASFFATLGELQHAARAVADSAGAAVSTPVARVAMITGVVNLTQLEMPLRDFLQGYTPEGTELFRAQAQAERLARTKTARTAQARDGATIKMYDFGDGPFTKGVAQGKAHHSELRNFVGDWLERRQYERLDLAGEASDGTQTRIRVLLAVNDSAFHYRWADAAEQQAAFRERRLNFQLLIQTERPAVAPPPAREAVWFNRRAFAAQSARYGMLAFATVFETWNMGACLARWYASDEVANRELYDLVEAMVDIAALSALWAESVRLASYGLDRTLARSVTEKMRVAKRLRVAPALSAAERQTWRTLSFCKWAVRFNVAAAVYAIPGKWIDLIQALDRRNYAAALGAGTALAGLIVLAVVDMISMFQLITVGVTASWLGPVGWLGLALLLIGTGIYYAFDAPPWETWLKHSPFGYQDPISLFTTNDPNGGVHAYWEHSPGLMYNELLHWLILPRIELPRRHTTNAPYQYLIIHLPFFGPDSELELDWAFASASELAPGQVLDESKLQSWHRELCKDVECHVDRDRYGQVRGMRYCFDLSRFPGEYLLRVRVRFFPHGKAFRVAGTPVVLPEPSRNMEGIPDKPKQGEELWLDQRCTAEGELWLEKLVRSESLPGPSVEVVPRGPAVIRPFRRPTGVAI